MKPLKPKIKVKLRSVIPPEPTTDINEMKKYELDKEYRREQIRSAKTRTMITQMQLAKERDELIAKDLVTKQLQFMIIAMKQQLLQVPNTYSRKLLHQEDVHVVHRMLTEAMHRALNEIVKLPLAVDPNWLETVMEEEDV